MSVRIDRVTDLLAVALSAIITLSIWGLFVWDYLNNGAPPGWLTALAVLLTLSSAIMLFGVEKVRQAIELRQDDQ